jgi:cytochrome c556
MQMRYKLAAALALAATTVSAQAQMKPEEVIQYRQGVFKAIRWNVAPMGAMVQGKMPFDQAAFLGKAQRLDQLAKMPWDGFGAGTDKGAPTRAKPEVWTDAAGFKKAADAFQAETPKLVAAAQSGNMDQIKAAFQGVIKTCDACHDNFRSK